MASHPPAPFPYEGKGVIKRGAKPLSSNSFPLIKGRYEGLFKLQVAKRGGTF